MLPGAPSAPPEAELIRIARKAAGMTAASAAEATKTHGAKGIGATYWGDVERGQGGRRGERVSVRASDQALAAMARVVGVTPPQLTGAGREDAARVLEEMLRREEATPIRPTGIAVIDEAVTAENLEPFIRQIRREIADAVIEYGPGASGAQIFGAQTFEAENWDSKRLPPDATVQLLAVFRSFAHRDVGGEGATRTGLTLTSVPAGYK